MYSGNETFSKTITFIFFQMLYSIKDRDDLKISNEIVSLQNQVNQ